MTTHSPWMLHRDLDQDGPWGVRDERGVNVAAELQRACGAEPSGWPFCGSRTDAEALIRAAGHEVGPVVRG